MLGRRVADVGGELPAGVQRVGAAHVAVAGDLGDDRRGGDRGRGRVALDDRALLVAAARRPRSRRTGRCSRAGRRRAARRAARRGSSCAARGRRSCARSARRRRPSAAVRMTIGKSSSRTSCVCCLESLRRLSARSSRVVSASMSNSTPAATSGPARQPRPASSAPATQRTPRRRSKREQAAAAGALARGRLAAARGPRRQPARPRTGAVAGGTRRLIASDAASGEAAVVRASTAGAHHEAARGRNR